MNPISPKTRSRSRDKSRIYTLVTLLMVTVMLSSFGRGLDINQRSLVHAIGIDTDEDGFKVTLQIFKPSGAGSDTPVDSSESNVRLISSHGKSVEEALADARAQTGQELFFGHLQVICIGSSTDLSAPEKLLAFALKDKSIYPGTPVCLGEASAEEVITAQPDFEETSAEAISKILETNSKFSNTVSCELIDIVTQSSEGVALPVLSVQEDMSGKQGEGGGEEKPKTVVMSSTAMISGGKVSDISLSREEAMCASFILGKGKSGSISIGDEGDNFSAEVKRNSTVRSAELENGKLIFNCTVTLVADPFFDIHDSRTSYEIAQRIEDYLNACTQSLVHKSSTLANADILEISKLVRHSFPKLYMRYEADPTALVSLAQIRIEYDVKVE